MPTLQCIWRQAAEGGAEAGVLIIGARAHPHATAEPHTASKRTAGSGSLGDVAMNHGGVNKAAEANGQRQNAE
jgi:hypothetical protein